MADDRPSKVRLAEVLDREGLVELSRKARAGHFADFESDSAMPIMDLVAALRGAGRGDLAARAIEGEWDG